MIRAVIGCGFGDEGKGRVVDYLCSLDPNSLVIRFCGGHQAGHHVVTKDIEHVFSNFGSGTLRGIPTYWSKYCTVDPEGILNELRVLQGKGIHPTLYIDRKCPVTTPYDKSINHLIELKNKHGSCGVGVGQTYQREEDFYSLLFEDLFYPSILRIKVNLIRKHYFSDSMSSEEFIEDCIVLTNLKNIKVTNGFPEDYRYSQCIFEGSQGLLLDQHIGFFPHVTRGNTGTKNIIEMGFEPEIYLVTRAYQTRHGNGPMTNVEYAHHIKPNPFEKNVDKCYQGKFRTSILDLDLLKYAINKDSYIKKTENKSLVITCLDLLEEYRLTINTELKYYHTEKKFVDEIKNYLEISSIYLSKSPLGPLQQ